jgi:hypothetical protein
MDDSGKGYRFGGFRSPRYTQVPDEAFDELMAVLTPAEFKVMMYVIRRTFGFKKDSDAISLSQIVSGVRTMDGRVLDRGTGLSKSGAVKAIKGLLEKQVIVVARRTSPAHGYEATVYQLHFADDKTRRPSKDGASRSPLVHSGDKGGLCTQKTGPCAPSGQALVHSPDTQETDAQDTVATSLSALAGGFLAAIGYAKPSRAKRERTIGILRRLHVEDGYSLEVIQAACRIAASMGARGPELIPHVIGKQEARQDEPEVGKRLAEAEQAARETWEAQATRFDALSETDRRHLIQRAKASNPIIAQRPEDHPLVRAAAIALLEG